MLTDEYIKRVYAQVDQRDGDQPEFLQAVREVFETIQPVVEKHPEYEKAGVLERIVEPERIVKFRVAWVDDEGKVQVNRGYRVQFNSAIGPYKGGLRFHPTVTEGVVKFLGFEQILKNSLTTLPMGGGKGGSDFNPKGKSDAEVMRFCQAFMTELCRHIGQFTDVPAGDINVGGREIGYLFGQYKRIRDEYSGVLTGKGLEFGGSLARTEATGYGVCYYTQEALRVLRNDSFEGKTVVVSGSGNVAIYAVQKAEQLGAKVVTVSDSNGYIYDPNGIDVAVVKQIKEVERGRIKEYAERVPSAEYHEGSNGVWTVPCDIALPCATQNEVDGESARSSWTTAEGGRRGREHAVHPGGHRGLPEERRAVRPGQGCQRRWRRRFRPGDEPEQLPSVVDLRRGRRQAQDHHGDIVANSLAAAKEYGHEGDLMLGANAAGFVKVANAMVAQGVL